MINCYICNKPIKGFGVTGACSSCNLKARNHGKKVVHKPLIRYCSKCNKKLSHPDRTGFCQPCSIHSGKDHYRKEGMYLKEKASNWKGGRRINDQGYYQILSHGHPYAQKYTHYVVKHRLVVEKFLGRYLKPSEDVHHRNNNRTDNSPYNLMGFISRSAHRRYEMGGEVSPDEIIFDGRKLK